MTEALQFEMERRVIVFHRDTSMPDDTQLGYTGDPNACVNGNTPGETLLYNSPAGTKYIDKASPPYTLWSKIEDVAGGTWIEDSSGGGVSGDLVELETFVLTGTDISNMYVALVYQPESISDIVLSIQHAPAQSYGIDFKQDATFLKRITWEGLALEPVLQEDDIITILYKR